MIAMTKLVKYFSISTLLITSIFANEPKTHSQVVVEEIIQVADIKINGDKPYDIQVLDDRFYTRVLKDGSLGLGESYMQGWWESDQLDETMFRIVHADLENNVKPTWSMKWAVLKAKVFNQQSKSKSLEVIDQHYQLGNDLFQLMLDDLMTYSCGYWENANNLNDAQKAKYDLIAKKLNFQKGMRVLDIGCGWGGFSKHVSDNYGVEVVGITLSENQAEIARKFCKNSNVEIRVQDYRDLNEKFDRIVEIGMFEHVGPKNYREFMEVVYRSLNENGQLMLHTIGSNQTSVISDPWIDKYIFRNGHIPSIAQIGTSTEGLFVMEDWHNFGPDYDTTLVKWYKNFDNNFPQIKNNYPDPFYKMWKYYLLSCAGAFRARNIQLWQVVFSKKGTLGRYTTVR